MPLPAYRAPDAAIVFFRRYVLPPSARIAVCSSGKRTLMVTPPSQRYVARDSATAPVATRQTDPTSTARNGVSICRSPQLGPLGARYTRRGTDRFGPDSNGHSRQGVRGRIAQAAALNSGSLRGG